MFSRHFLHDLHGKLVVVRSYVRCRIDGRQLMLRRSDLIVFGFGKDPQLPEFLVQVLHESNDPGLDNAEIMVVQLLALRRHGSEQCSSRVYKVRTLFEHLPVDQEVFLLRSDAGPDVLHIPAEQLQDSLCLAVQRLHGAKERRFLIQRVPCVGAECRGDAQCMVFNERIGCGIPGGVASCFKCRPQAPRRKGRCVRFSLNQLFSAEFHDDTAVRGRSDKAVMLLSSNARQRLEPVGKMCGALLHGPVPHLLRHSLRNVLIQFRVLIDRSSQRTVYLCREPCPHDSVIKHL